ncbi:MAG: TolC family protein [Chitinophagaceae bacterium]|nr:TolC family protein [Chitinophagaceae bacterium]
MRFTRFVILASALLFSLSGQAQKKWNLLQCVEYAMANNISVKQTDLQTKLAELQYNQSKWGRLPNLNFSGGPAYNSGRNQDPTSFSLITQSYLSANMQLQSSAEIFNWFSRKNTIAANEWEVQAAKASTDKLKNDIALTVANAYLQILLAREQEKIAGVQLQQSQSQLVNTRKLVDAGALPELNAAELEAQVARDSSTFISAHGNVEQSLLNLKSFMSIDAGQAFDIDMPPADKIPVEKLSDLQPEAVYASAIANMPQQRFNDFKLRSARKTSAAARGDLYPTLSVFGSLGSGFNSRAKEVTGSYPLNSPLGTVKVGGTDYSVYPFQPYTTYTYGKTAFFSQLNENFRQSLGLTLSVPIFNGKSLRTAYERTKVNIRNFELQKEMDDLKLKQDIYQAYNASTVALEKFNASKKTVEAAERTYSFAKKRYDVGMLSTFELITNQNNLFRAKLEYALNQFDYVFKMKVLEFYKGQGLKL